MTPLTDTQAQQFLAEKLKERIRIDSEHDNPTLFYWRKGYEPHPAYARVTPAEWDYIARLVEEKMTAKQKSDYMITIWESLLFRNRFEQTCASPTIRATAMKEAGL